MRDGAADAAIDSDADGGFGGCVFSRADSGAASAGLSNGDANDTIKAYPQSVTDCHEKEEMMMTDSY